MKYLIQRILLTGSILLLFFLHFVIPVIAGGEEVPGGGTPG